MYTDKEAEQFNSWKTSDGTLLKSLEVAQE